MLGGFGYDCSQSSFPCSGVRAVTLDIEGNGDVKAKTYVIKYEKEDLGKNYTFKLREDAVIYWQQKYEVTASSSVPTTVPSTTTAAAATVSRMAKEFALRVLGHLLVRSLVGSHRSLTRSRAYEKNGFNP